MTVRSAPGNWRRWPAHSGCARRSRSQRRAKRRPTSFWTMRRTAAAGRAMSCGHQQRLRCPQRALVDRHVGALGGADVELARTADLLLGVLDHLLPLGDPADGARHREQHGEHRQREAHRAQRDARIEVDVGIELLLDEIVVLQRDALQLHRHLQDLLVLDAERVEHLVAGLLPSPWRAGRSSCRRDGRSPSGGTRSSCPSPS